MPRFRYDPVVPDAGSIGELLERRGQIHANRARAVGDVNARAALARGQAWGDAAGSIGDVISRGMQAYVQEREEAPRRAQQLETGRQQNELGRMEIASARKTAEDKAILGSAQGSGLEPEQVKAQLAQLGRGDLIPIYEQTHASIENARLGLQKTRTEVANLEADYFGAIAAGVKKAKYDPMAVEWALAQADADGHDTKQIRGLLTQNPQALPQIIDTLIEKSPTQRKLIGEETDRELKRQTEARALADMQADNARQTATAAETARHNTELERISRMTAGRQESAATETARHNRAMEENARNAKLGRPVTSGDADKLAELTTSLDDLAVLRGTVSTSGATGTYAKVGASVPNWVTEWTGFGADAKSKQGVIDRVKQVIGKALEGGVLRKEDEYKYEKILPTISDVANVVETKLAGLEQAISLRRDRQMEALADAGYDVSRFSTRQDRDAQNGDGEDGGAGVRPAGRPANPFRK